MKNTVVIANGQTKSSVAYLQRNAVQKIVFPAALTGTSFSFEESEDGTTFKPVNSTSGLYTIVGAAGVSVHLPPTDLNYCNYLKIVSGSTEGGDRSIDIYSTDYVG